MKARSYLLMALIGCVSVQSGARSVFDFAVISAENIRSRECDFQGSTVAGQNAEFFNFALGNELTAAEKIDSRLLVGGHLNFTNGSNDLSWSSIGENLIFDAVMQNSGLRVGGFADMSKVSLPGTLELASPLPPRLNLSEIGKVETIPPFSDADEILRLLQEMQSRSTCYARLPKNHIGWQGTPGRYQFVVFRGYPDRDLQVYEVEKSTWDAANGIKIIGNPSMKFIINVRGSVVNMVRKGFMLEGGVRLNQILLNFPEAQQISLSQSGTDQGTPTILAPHAQILHSSNLVSGSVLVRDYEGWFQGHCGQVNNHFTDRFIDPSICQ